jgi:hypothetical protein
VGRVIDFPLERLPEIDEHGTLVLAPVPDVWEALLEVVSRSFSGWGRTGVAAALGCAQTEARGKLDRIGSTVPGFVVARVVEPAVLALEGEHRFSRYALIFRLEGTRDANSLLRAETRAEFPGLQGAVYKGLVIGSRGHALAVVRILSAVRSRAEG